MDSQDFSNIVLVDIFAYLSPKFSSSLSQNLSRWRRSPTEPFASATWSKILWCSVFRWPPLMFSISQGSWFSSSSISFPSISNPSNLYLWKLITIYGILQSVIWVLLSSVCFGWIRSLITLWKFFWWSICLENGEFPTWIWWKWVSSCWFFFVE